MCARSRVFFLLTVFFISGIQNELRPDAENVCQQTEIYEETIMEKVKKPVKEYKKARCKKLFNVFSCKKQVTVWKEVDEPRVVQKSRSVLKCCAGYKEIQENAAKCVPVCSTGCAHGKCTAPDKCTCTPGFQGPACNMRSGVTAADGDFALKSSTQEVFQTTTEESELEALTSTSENLKITNTDFMTESTEEATVSMAEATVTMSDATNYETSTTELDEKEISKEKFQNGKFAMDVKLDLPKLTTAFSEETKTTSKYSKNLKKAEGLENGVPNFSEKLITAGNEIPSNPKLNLEFEEHISKPTKIYGENPEVYDFTSLLYILLVSCFVLGFALWIIIKRRKKIRESQTEKQLPFISKEPLEFCVDNILWRKLFRNRSESPISMSEIEANSTQPILLGLSNRNRSGSPIDTCEAEPNNAKPILEGIFI